MDPDRTDESPARLRPVDAVVVFGLLLVTAVAFAAAPGFGFVNLDDGLYVTQNGMVQRGLSADGVRWALTTGHAANWHPLTWLSLMLDAELQGVGPRGFHRTSLALHLANTALFYLLTLRLTGARWASAFAAALFGWHPLRVEAVAWISQRKEVLSMTFALLGLLAYERYARRPARGWLLLVACLLALGLLAKPVLVTFPFALLLLDAWPLRRIAAPTWLAAPETGGRYARASLGALVREKLPLFVLVAASSYMTLVAQAGGGAIVSTVSPAFRLANAVVSYVRYVFKTLWPARLSAQYVYFQQIDLLVIGLALGALALVTVVAWRKRRQAPYLLTGWLWFLGTLVPMIGVVQVGAQSMADRYTYWSGIGLFWIAAFGARDLVRRLRIPAPAVAIACALVLATLFAVTRRQVAYWQSSEALFGHVADLDPGNVFAIVNVAAMMIDDGRLEEARVRLERGLAAHGDVPELLVNLAGLEARQGRPERGLALVERALKVVPDNAAAHLNYAAIALQLQRLDDARTHFERVVAVGGDGNLSSLVMAHRGLAIIDRTQGRPAEAQAHEAEAARLQGPAGG